MSKLNALFHYPAPQHRTRPLCNYIKNCFQTFFLLVLSFLNCLRSSNLPGDFVDADFIASLLVVVKPFTFVKFDASELGVGVNAIGQPLSLNVKSVESPLLKSLKGIYFSLEFCELKSSTVKLKDLLRLRRLGLLIRSSGTSDSSRRLALRRISFTHTCSLTSFSYLAVLAPPDKVGFATASTHVIRFLVSCQRWSLLQERSSYKSIDTNEVIMHLSA